mgnify:CR=1 FL=1
MSNDKTIDPREVEYYTRMAATWWDREGPFWPLHTLNELRLTYIRDHLCQHFDRDAGASRPLQGLRVLDVGCGGGILSESMAMLGAEVTAIDVVEKNINIARLHAQGQRLEIDYRLTTAAELAASPRGTVDLVHVPEIPHPLWQHVSPEAMASSTASTTAPSTAAPSWLTRAACAASLAAWSASPGETMAQPSMKIWAPICSATT